MYGSSLSYECIYFAFFPPSVNSLLNTSGFLFCPKSCRKILLDECHSYRGRRPHFVCKFCTFVALLISSAGNVSGLQRQFGQILVSGPGWGYYRVKDSVSCKNDRTFHRGCSTVLTKGFSRAKPSAAWNTENEEVQKWKDRSLSNWHLNTQIN